MSNSIIDVLTSLNLTPTYLLILGALIGYFRHQHAGGKVPGALSIPNDLLKSSEFNKLWTLLYVVLLPLSWIVNVFAYAVYALMWLINVIGGIVHWATSKLLWVWNQVIIGLGGFSFYQLWHYLVKWPYQLFNILLSTFVASFNWATYKSTYRGVVIASLVGVSGFLLDDIFDKIDAHRAGALMEVLGQAQFGQVFISDTDRNRIPGLLDEAGVPYRSWWVDARGVTAMEPKTSTAE